jgi:hypothetical protein
LGLFVLECCLLALLAATAVWTLAREARREARRADLRRALREVVASLSGEAGESLVGLDLEGARHWVRVLEEPGLREAIVIAIELDSAREAAEPAGYRGGTARAAGRPWIVIRPGLRWRSDGRRRELAPLLAGPKLRSALATVFDAGADRVHVNDGAPTIAAVLRAPRPEQLNAFALREVARGLVAVASALPAFDGPPRASTRIDASHVALALTVALAVTAPFFPWVAVHAWPPLAPVVKLGATGAVMGVLTWMACVCAASAFMRAWPLARRRTLGGLLALFVALPADGVGFAIGLNALGPQHRDYKVGWLYDHIPSRGGEGRWIIALRDDPLYESDASPDWQTWSLPDDRLAYAADHCPQGANIVLEEGWFGVRWLGPASCSERTHLSRVLRRSTDPIATPFGFAHLGTVFEKPPATQEYVDLHVHNGAASPRWFLLPETLGLTPGPSTSRSSMRAVRLTGIGSVVVVELPDANLQAILLPASGDVVLRGVVLHSVRGGLPPKRLEIVALAVDEILLGDRRLEAFFDEPISSSFAVVDDCRRGASCPLLPVRDVGDGPFELGASGVERLRADAEYHARSPFVE